MKSKAAFDFQPIFRKTTLSQGVRVVTEHHPYSRSTAAAIYVQFGTRDELKKLNGAAHFIEHMVFKGTHKRTAFAIAKSLEAVGGELNAYTSREMTCFHTLSLREHLPLCISVLADLMCNATFHLKDFEKEKQVIFQEIDMSSDFIEEHIYDLFFEKIFARQPLGRSILGTRESLNKMDRDLLFECYQKQYQGAQLIVSIAGDVDHENVVKLIQTSLSWHKTRSRVKVNKKVSQKLTPQFHPFKETIYRKSEQVHMLLGFPSVSVRDQLRFESYIVNTLLGGGMTSRLYQRVREEKGLVYSIYSQLQTFSDSGLLMIYAGTTPDNVKKVLRIIRMEMEKLIKKGISQKELNFFKTQVKGALLLGSDDVESRMNSIAVNEMMFQEYRPVENILTEIDAITVESLHSYIKQYLDRDKLSVLLVGPLKNKQESSIWKEI